MQTKKGDEKKKKTVEKKKPSKEGNTGESIAAAAADDEEEVPMKCQQWTITSDQGSSGDVEDVVRGDEVDLQQCGRDGERGRDESGA